MQTVLYFVAYWPQQSFSAASQRTFQLAQHLRGAGYRVVVCADGDPDKQIPPHGVQDLEALGCECLRVRTNDPSSLEQISQIKPDVVIFDKFTTEEKFGWQVSLKVPQALRVLDTVDLHWLRKGRETQVKELDLNLAPALDLSLDRTEARAFRDSSILASPGTPELIAKASGDTFERELASIFRCDTALLVSEVEKHILTHWCMVPRHQLFVNQLSYQTSLLEPLDENSFRKRQHFYFVGNFKHAPNLDAVHWLKKILWPQMRAKLQGAGLEGQLHIYGASSGASSGASTNLSLHDPKMGFYLKGHTLHINFQDYRVNLAPLRFGAGIKGKIAEGWSHGTPAITTPVGGEGMHGQLAFGGKIAETTEAFVAEAVSIYSDPIRWIEASERGLRIIKSVYSQETNSLEFTDYIAACLENLVSIRQKNMMGRILNHQSMRATEYFSRWIQAKQTLRNQPVIG